MKTSLVCLSLSLLLVTQKAYAHGNHGGGGISSEDDLAAGNHIHLPVRIEATGELIFGYESPFGETQGHEGEVGGHEDHGHEEHGQEDHEHEDHDSDEAAHDHSHSFHIAPTLIIGGEKIDKIVSKDALEDATVGVGQVSTAKNGKGFIHIKSTKLLLGLGVEIHKHLNIGALGGGLGLVYAKNQSCYSEIHLNSLAEKGRSLKLPGSYAEFSKWRNEEKISYISSGSIIFTMGAGIHPVIHGGVIASASGTWLVKLQKIDQDFLNVSVSSVKAYSFGAEVDSVVVSLSAERLKSAEKGLNFNLNMKSPKAISALKQIYNGDLRTVQKLAQDKDMVFGLEKSEGVSEGNGRSLNFNLPFFFGLGTSKYSMDSYQVNLKNNDQERGIAYTSIITKEQTSKGILSNHKKEVEQFSTTYVDEAHEDHRDTYFAANFKWHYEKDEVKANVLKSKLEELSLQVGLDKLNDLGLPLRELGHFRISFDISFTESDIFSILTTLTNTKEVAVLKKVSATNIDKFISIHSYQEICPELNHKKVIGDKKSVCARSLKSKTASLIEKLVKLSNAVTSDVKKKKIKTAVAGFSEMGNLMVKNQFVFKELIQNLLDLEISLSVEGEKITKQKMIL
jgi:hypothetical protein